MRSPSQHGRNLIAPAAAAWILYWAAAISAVGQTTPANLPADCGAASSIPLPTEATAVPTPKSFPVCESYKSYSGIGRPVNYGEARACAWQERLAQQASLPQSEAAPSSLVVGGSLILADIYFNGAGVERNVPLAMRFACEFEPASLDRARPAIAGLKSLTPDQGPFELCNFAESTFTMDFCTSYHTDITDDRRSRYYSSLKAAMSSEQKEAFDKLLSSQKAYVDAHRNEVDQGGTISGIRTLGSMEILNDIFHTEIVHFERGKWPQLTNRQIANSDAALRRQYEKTLQELRARPKEERYEGEVAAEHVSQVEKAWEPYRDAWIAFARLRYPNALSAIRAEITLDRYRLLKTIP